MANEKNLKPNTARTPKERRELAQKAGKASGEARKEKKLIQEALRKALTGKYDVDGQTLDGYNAMAMMMLKEALSGNVQAFKEIRDSVEGKPIDRINATIENDNKELLKEYLEEAKHGTLTKSKK